MATSYCNYPKRNEKSMSHHFRLRALCTLLTQIARHSTLQMFTGIYGYFIGKSEFQIYGDCMLPTILVIFEINTLCGLLISTLNSYMHFKFLNNFCQDFRLPVIPVKFICMLRGTLCDTEISYTFYRGKICSVYLVDTNTSIKDLAK